MLSKTLLSEISSQFPQTLEDTHPVKLNPGILDFSQK